MSNKHLSDKHLSDKHLSNKHLSNKHHVLVLEELVGVELTSPDGLTEAEASVLHLSEPQTLTPDQLIARVSADPQITGIICPLSQQITAEVFARLPQLQVVANIAVGLDNIDLEAARDHQVSVIHTPAVLTEATADLAWALLLGGTRRLVEGDALARSGAWAGWEMRQLLGRSIGGRGRGADEKTLGVIGLGAIGEAIARRARGFDMRVHYFSRTRKPDLEEREGWCYQPLDELVCSADYLVLAAPLTPETHHLMNRERLSALKPDAYIVNIGRGALIDELALIELLEAGHLSGAALDVYEREPFIPPRLRALSQVTLSPHLGSATFEARREMSRVVLEGVSAVLQGADLSDIPFAVAPLHTV